MKTWLKHKLKKIDAKFYTQCHSNYVLKKKKKKAILKKTLEKTYRNVNNF